MFSPDDIAKIWPSLTDEEKAELDAMLASDDRRWRPIPDSPQWQAYYSTADNVGYGGAAGGGKSELIIGMCLEKFTRSLIIRREKAQTQGIIQRFDEVLGHRVGFNSQQSIWRLGHKLIEFGGCDNMGDEKRWQGRPHDLKAFDEVTEQREAQVRFIMGWLRTSDPNIKPQSYFTFNPPTTAEGRWVIRFYAPWLDDKHPNPAKPGELRYFTTVGDNHDFECPDGRPFVMYKGQVVHDFDPSDFKPEEIRRPRSRTFIPSRVTDNPYYMQTGYIDTLNALPEPLRSQMLNGDFMAGVEDDEWQVIPTAWVDAAMDRWTVRNEKGPMDALGVDPSRGGRDKFILSPRHGTYFDELIEEPGIAVPDGPMGAAYVIKHRKDAAPIQIDIIGWGASVYDSLVSNGIQTVAINGATKATGRAVDNQLKFFNLRSQLWWRMREALNPTNPYPIYLPDDADLRADLTAPKWSLAPAGIKVEGKEDIKKRLGRSPDRGDAVCYALVQTPKTYLLEQGVDNKPYDRYEELEG